MLCTVKITKLLHWLYEVIDVIVVFINGKLPQFGVFIPRNVDIFAIKRNETVFNLNSDFIIRFHKVQKCFVCKSFNIFKANDSFSYF